MFSPCGRFSRARFCCEDIGGKDRIPALKTHDFYFDLPPELIAQTPLQRRDASRLLTLDKTTGQWEHRHFYELPQLLRPGDCLIMNDSRVLPALSLIHI